MEISKLTSETLAGEVDSDSSRWTSQLLCISCRDHRLRPSIPVCRPSEMRPAAITGQTNAHVPVLRHQTRCCWWSSCELLLRFNQGSYKEINARLHAPSINSSSLKLRKLKIKQSHHRFQEDVTQESSHLSSAVYHQQKISASKLLHLKDLRLLVGCLL